MAGIEVADVQIDRIAPRAADVVGPHDHVGDAIRTEHRKVDVEAALVVNEIGRPDVADVAVERGPHRIPVHQIPRVPDQQPRHAVERRMDHVVVAAEFPHRRVRIVACEDRVYESTVAEVGFALALDASGETRHGVGRPCRVIDNTNNVTNAQVTTGEQRRR